MEKSLYLDLDSEKLSGCQMPFSGQIIVPSGHGFKLETFELLVYLLYLSSSLALVMFTQIAYFIFILAFSTRASDWRTRLHY